MPAWQNMLSGTTNPPYQSKSKEPTSPVDDELPRAAESASALPQPLIGA